MQAIFSVNDLLKTDEVNKLNNESVGLSLFELNIDAQPVTIIQGQDIGNGFICDEDSAETARFILNTARAYSQTHYYLIDDKSVYIVYAKDGRKELLGKLAPDITAQTATRFQFGREILGVFK